MIYLALVLTTVFAVETFLFIPIMPPITNLLELGKKIPRVILSPKISDHWKEKVLLKYALLMGINSVKIFFWMLISLALIVLVLSVMDLFIDSGASVLELASTTGGLAVMTVTSIIYYYLRQQFVRS